MKLIDQWMEVFRAGDYGEKGSYTEADLDELVRNYDTKVHEAPVVVGHPEDNKPAFGWVESLKRVGNTLLAKFKQIEPKFEELVKEGRFKKRSISFYKEPKLMLRHIGFLGAMPPEVKGLADPKFRDGEYKLIEFTDTEESMDPKAIVQAMKDAFSEIFGGKKPSMFSEEDVSNLLSKGIEKALTTFKETVVKPMETTITTLQGELKTFREGASNTDMKLKVDGLIAPLKQANKWIPAFDELKLPLIIERLMADTTTKVVFGEGDKRVEISLAETLVNFLGALPAMVPLGTATTNNANGSHQAGANINFNDKPGAQIEGRELAQAATDMAAKEKISFGEALKRCRQFGIGTGRPSAGAV